MSVLSGMARNAATGLVSGFVSISQMPPETRILSYDYLKPTVGVITEAIRHALADETIGWIAPLCKFIGEYATDYRPRDAQVWLLTDTEKAELEPSLTFHVSRHTQGPVIYDLSDANSLPTVRENFTLKEVVEYIRAGPHILRVGHRVVRTLSYPLLVDHHRYVIDSRLFVSEDSRPSDYIWPGWERKEPMMLTHARCDSCRDVDPVDSLSRCDSCSVYLCGRSDTDNNGNPMCFNLLGRNATVYCLPCAEKWCYECEDVCRFDGLCVRLKDATMPPPPFVYLRKAIRHPIGYNIDVGQVIESVTQELPITLESHNTLVIGMVVGIRGPYAIIKVVPSTRVPRHILDGGVLTYDVYRSNEGQLRFSQFTLLF